MEVFFGWIVLSFVVGWVWSVRGLSFGAGLLISVLLSPLVGLIVGLVKKPSAAQADKVAIAAGGVRKCPYCAEIIKAEAVVCRFCGKDVAGPNQMSSDPGGSTKGPRKTFWDGQWNQINADGTLGGRTTPPGPGEGTWDYEKTGAGEGKWVERAK